MQESKVRVQVKLRKQQVVQIVTLVLTIIMLTKYCRPCNAGQFQDGYGATSCKPCAAGSLGLVWALVLVLNVQQVKFNQVKVQVYHVACGFGTRAVERVRCEVCPNGQATFTKRL